jgi:hypothetical protein
VYCLGTDCPVAGRGDASAAPPRSVMNSRRFTGNFSRAPKGKIAPRESYCTAGFRRSLCRLWVICVESIGRLRSRHARFAPKADNYAGIPISPLSARKRHMHRSKRHHYSITSSARTRSVTPTPASARRRDPLSTFDVNPASVLTRLLRGCSLGRWRFGDVGYRIQSRRAYLAQDVGHADHAC